MKIYFKLPNFEGWRRIVLYLVLVINLAAILALWLVNSNYYIVNPADGNIYIAFGRVFGLLSEFLLLLQLVLISRATFIEQTFGFDRLNQLHRWIGYGILTFLLGHPILLLIGDGKANGVGWYAQLLDFLGNKDGVVNSFIALIIFIYIIYLSVFVRKKVKYEWWYFPHLLTYVAIGIAFGHQIHTGDFIEGAALYYWLTLNYFVFGLVLLYRALKPLFRFGYHRFYVEKVVAESPDTVSLYIAGHHMDKFKFHAGQYANITLLDRKTWYPHPFSFSTDYNGKVARFTIKSSGDYTSKIVEVKPGTRVIIDGPLGMFVQKRAQRDKFLLIAGGIGITPLRSLVGSLAMQSKDIVLLYAVKTEKDMVFKSEIEYFQSQNKNIVVKYILSTPTPGYESGFLDKEKITRLVPDFYDREVYLCGPPPMMKSVVSNLKEIGFASEYIHFEKFSF